jgi:predicted nucleotidyltransferase
MLNFEQFIEKKPEDITIFGIMKFVGLALDCNPNILELLFMPEDCILKTTSEWEKIVEIRDSFLSTKVKHTYTGYAFSQLKRIKTHRAWLLNPTKKKPEREDFDLIKHGKMPQDLTGAIQSLEEKDAEEALKLMPTIIMSLYQKERAYQNALKQWKQYQEWLKSRNPARAELEKKYNFDVKHGSHVFRLLIQGKQILTTGTLFTRLDKEAQEFCRAIRAGKYKYKELMEMAETEIKSFDELEKNSPLPRVNNKKKVHELLVDILKKHFRYDIIGSNECS